MDQEIKREQQATNEIVQSMPAAKQEKYFSIMDTSEELLQVSGQFYYPNNQSGAFFCRHPHESDKEWTVVNARWIADLRVICFY